MAAPRSICESAAVVGAEQCFRLEAPRQGIPGWARRAEPNILDMRMTGKVVWFDDSKGYGFIRQKEGPDVFVHYTSIIASGHRTLNAGDEVEFEATQRPEGLQANSVQKLGGFSR